MALHSVDKNLNSRSKPYPNSHDLFVDHQGAVQPMAHATPSVQYTQPGFVPQTMTGPGGTQIPLASLGQFLATGTMNCTPTGSLEDVFSIPHGLGYAPIVIGMMNNSTVTGISDNGTTTVMLPTWLKSAIGTVGGSSVFLFTKYATMMSDPTSVFCYLVNPSADTTPFAITYYLYKQNSNQIG